MTRLLTGIGSFLLAWGLVTYFASESRSGTALIPAGFGACLLICGFLSVSPGKRRKHAIHAGLLVALLGVLAPLGRVVPQALNGEFALSIATISMAVLMASCIIVLVKGIGSFKAARA
ncbi:MAG: hypothetical protein AAF432_09840 [Planctomycetota bacterium]